MEVPSVEDQIADCTAQSSDANGCEQKIRDGIVDQRHSWSAPGPCSAGLRDTLLRSGVVSSAPPDATTSPPPPADRGEANASDRSLPVTGGALTGLVLAALVSTSAGGAALWIARRSQTSATAGEDDA